MEATARAVDFFLGTTTPAGFKGYFAELCREDGRRMYLIKSGPGCGKSTLMKRLADRAGEPVERIHCSSDPDSLDGVVFCRQGAALVDATAPHVLEPEAPGAEETVISLYDTIDAAALRRVFDNILSNPAKYTDGDLSVRLTRDGRVTISNRVQGLDRVQAGRLFDRFFTVEAANGSTGLGLSIAQSLTSLQQGTFALSVDGDLFKASVTFDALS